MIQFQTVAFIVLATLNLSCINPPSGKEEERSRPNDILFITDDQGYGDMDKSNEE